MIPLIYTQRPFYINGFDPLLMLHATILPSRWSAIRHLHLDGRNIVAKSYPVSRVSAHHAAQVPRANDPHLLEDAFLRAAHPFPVLATPPAERLRLFRESAWAAACAAVCRLYGLRVLRVRLARSLYEDLMRRGIYEEFVWIPLLDVRLPRLSCFEVSVDWRPGAEWVERERKFKIIACYTDEDGLYHGPVAL